MNTKGYQAMFMLTTQCAGRKKSRAAFIWLFLSCGILSACNPTDANESENYGPGQYVEKPASPDGTGKFYYGREIAQVMGHLGAAWLERSKRVQEERTDLLLDALPIDANDVIADIGAGTGYFSFPMAERVPQGKVLAVDIQPEMLDMITSLQEKRGVTNIETVLGKIDDPNLPANSVDLILMVDAYHEFSHPYEMGVAMANALKPGGNMVLIEYRGEDVELRIKKLHKMTQEQVIKEMSAIGLEWKETMDILPTQHFMVFTKQ